MIDNKYIILKDLGEGSYSSYYMIISFSVKLVKSIDGVLYAAKIFKEKEGNKSEFEILKKLDSFWILKVKDFNEHGRISQINNKQYAEDTYNKYKDSAFSYLIMELAENGELFDFVEISGALPEKISRYYFHIVIEVIGYLHSNNIAHNDIKLQNLLTTADYNIKLADFGLARKFSEYNSSFLGTISYMPPELLGSEEYRSTYESKIDIYSAGVVLFNMVSGCRPYKKASYGNDLFDLFRKDKENFWKHHENYSFEGRISQDLKDLISGMLESNPRKRWNLEQIKACIWYNEACATPKQIVREMRRRKSSIELAKMYPEKKTEIIKASSAECKKMKKPKLKSKFSYEKIGRFAYTFLSELFS